MEKASEENNARLRALQRRAAELPRWQLLLVFHREEEEEEEEEDENQAPVWWYCP